MRHLGEKHWHYDSERWLVHGAACSACGALSGGGPALILLLLRLQHAQISVVRKQPLYIYGESPQWLG